MSVRDNPDQAMKAFMRNGMDDLSGYQTDDERLCAAFSGEIYRHFHQHVRETLVRGALDGFDPRRLVPELWGDMFRDAVRAARARTPQPRTGPRHAE